MELDVDLIRKEASLEEGRRLIEGETHVPALDAVLAMKVAAADPDYMELAAWAFDDPIEAYDSLFLKVAGKVIKFPEGGVSGGKKVLNKVKSMARQAKGETGDVVPMDRKLLEKTRRSRHNEGVMARSDAEDRLRKNLSSDNPKAGEIMEDLRTLGGGSPKKKKGETPSFGKEIGIGLGTGAAIGAGSGAITGSLNDAMTPESKKEEWRSKGGPITRFAVDHPALYNAGMGAVTMPLALTGKSPLGVLGRGLAPAVGAVGADKVLKMREDMKKAAARMKLALGAPMFQTPPLPSPQAPTAPTAGGAGLKAPSTGLKPPAMPNAGGMQGGAATQAPKAPGAPQTQAQGQQGPGSSSPKIKVQLQPDQPGQQGTSVSVG